MGFFDIFRKSVKKTKQSLSLELDSFSGKITLIPWRSWRRSSSWPMWV